MKYIYDIKVNLSKRLHDFYDWKPTDNIVILKKIPVIKVNTKTYLDILYNEVQINNKVNKLIVTNSENALYIEVNNKGKIIIKSKLLIENELEVINMINNQSYLKYKVIKVNNRFNKLTRNQEEIVNRIIKELNEVKEDKDKMTYLYKEWFNKDKSSFEELKTSIKNEYTSKHKKLLNTLLLLTNKNV